MCKKVLIIVGFCLVTLTSFSQRITNSPYSRYGIGDLNTESNGLSNGMGGASIGRRTPGLLNYINPASYSSLVRNSFLFEVGGNNKVTDFKTNKASQKSINSNLNFLGMAFAYNNWAAGSFGVAPYSSVGYTIKEDELVISGSDSTYNQSIYTGQGGLNQVYFGNAFRIGKYVSVGVNAAYVFGSVDKNFYNFIEESNFYSETTIEQRNLIRGFYFRTGIQFQDTVGEKLTYTIGAVYDKEFKLSGENTYYMKRYLNYSYIDFSDTLRNDTLNSGKIVIPQKLGFGFAVNYFNKFTIAADYWTQDWSKSTFFGQNPGLINASSMSVGLEYCRDPYSKRYFRTIRYRVGANLTNSYVELKNQKIKDQRIGVGLGIPLKGSMVNIGFEAGKKGTLNDNLIEEKYYLLNLSFSFFDIWFIKPKFF